MDQYHILQNIFELGNLRGNYLLHGTIADKPDGNLQRPF